MIASLYQSGLAVTRACRGRRPIGPRRRGRPSPPDRAGRSSGNPATGRCRSPSRSTTSKGSSPAETERAERRGRSNPPVRARGRGSPRTGRRRRSRGSRFDQQTNCSLSVRWKRSEVSRCSAGWRRRIRSCARPMSRRLSGVSRSQCRISYFSECRYSSEPGSRAVLDAELEHRSVDAVVGGEARREHEAGDERRPVRRAGGARAGCRACSATRSGGRSAAAGPRVSSVKYSSISQRSVRQVKYV